jgi:3-oxoacyl-[acyl-carrier-protein] synthase-3
LADFVASLGVSVQFLPAGRGHVDKVAELVERAKDFTLGIRHSAADIAGRADEITAIAVRDRLGDYGVSGAVALRLAAGTCTVDLFSLSCPVLGKEVEDAVLREILARAGRDGCASVVFRYQPTEHNRVAVRFLQDAASRVWPGEDGREIRIQAQPPGGRVDDNELSGADPGRTDAGPAVPFGIAGLAHVLAEPVDVAAAAPEYTVDLDRVRGWEYRRFHRATGEIGITDLAVEAGRRALANAGLDAAGVDLVVLAISDIAEYLYWDPAAATQARLGAHRAEALLLNQACGSGVAAFDVVAGKFAAHPEYRHALIIGANRVCEAYWNRMEINTSIYSDGAAAAVLRRGHGACRWLATEIISDGRYADFMRMDVGGAARPFSPDDPAPVMVRSPFDRLDEFFDGDVRRMFDFVATMRARNREVIEAACARAGVALADVARVFHFNDNVKQLTELAGDLDISVERTNVQLATEHAHLGCADQLLSLERQLASGDLTSGDLVALTSTSSGMHWICTLLRV